MQYKYKTEVSEVYSGESEGDKQFSSRTVSRPLFEAHKKKKRTLLMIMYFTLNMSRFLFSVVRFTEQKDT